MKFLVTTAFLLLGTGFSVGFVLGQRNIMNAYDPKTLEANSLDLVGQEHLNGCIVGVANLYKKGCAKNPAPYDCGNLGPYYEFCDHSAFDAYQTLKVSWHNIIWKRKDNQTR